MGGEGRTGPIGLADPARHHTRRGPSGVAERRPWMATIDSGRVPVDSRVPDLGSDREAEGCGPHADSAGRRVRQLAIAEVAGPADVGANAYVASALGWPTPTDPWPRSTTPTGHARLDADLVTLYPTRGDGSAGTVAGAD